MRSLTIEEVHWILSRMMHHAGLGNYNTWLVAIEGESFDRIYIAPPDRPMEDDGQWAIDSTTHTLQGLISSREVPAWNVLQEFPDCFDSILEKPFQDPWEACHKVLALIYEVHVQKISRQVAKEWDDAKKLERDSLHP